MLRAALVASVTLAVACTDVSATETKRPREDSASEPRADDEVKGAADVEPNASVTASMPTGLVVIDLQRSFFSLAKEQNPTIDTGKIEANAIKLLRAAETGQRPIVITFEASTAGEAAMPDALKAAVPASAKQLVKTTFGATGLPAFRTAIAASGLRRVVVVGAETDVCVLQTMLGLREAGNEVVAVSDGLMSEEPNTAPALRRMRQAGIAIVTTQEAEAVLAGGAAPSAAPDATARRVRPLETGIFLHDVAGLGANDSKATQKKARLRELFLISEWFSLPVLAADPAATLAALPADLKTLLKRPIVALANRPAAVKQLAIAGGTTDLARTVAGLNADVFVLSDALIGATNESLEPLYAAGAVPTTYKSLYYELTVSVSNAEWPSPQWVASSDPYFDLTKAPEALPPLL